VLLGLSFADWIVIVAYIVGITAVGLYANRKVAGTGDYFMGGRRFGRLLMIAQAFGTGTRTEQVVAVSGGAASVGLAAIWFQWLYLFSTPFFWILAPIYRRLRYLTVGDFFEKRFGTAMGATYAAVGLAYFIITTGIMLKGAGVTIEAITGGAVSTEAAVIAMVLFFVVYSITGGLVAAVFTQAVQGLFILILSFMLIPFALVQAGGLSGIRAGLPGDRDWFSLVASEEVTLFYIVMAVINALVGVTIQPHHMAINGAGKDELSCRTGWTYGIFLKRFATIGWAFTGVFVAALFPILTEADRGARELAFGTAARELLPVGLVGLLVAAVTAAVVAAASSFMVNGSALFTRNFYRRYMRTEASDAHYLLVGRFASFAVVALGVVMALTLESVISGLEWIWRLMAFMGISFWVSIAWRRANRFGAWASLVITAVLAIVTNQLGWSFPAQVALYLPAGFLSMILVSALTRPEPKAALDEFYILLRTPVGQEHRLRAAGIETIHEIEAAGEDAGAGIGTSEAIEPEPIPDPDDDSVAASRGESLLLTNLLSLWKDFSLRRYRVDLKGFGIAWLIVIGIILLAYGLAAIAAKPAQGQDTPAMESFTHEYVASQEQAAWAMLPEILSRINPPDIPNRECVVTDFGASPDSTVRDDRPAILEALQKCARQGGGRVVLPPGDYLSNGPIHFENNIELHLEEGATLRFGTDPEFYTPLVLTRWEGTFAYNYSPLLYARDKENVAITGRGTIDGQTEGTWSLWKRDNDGKNQQTDDNKPRLRRMGAEGTPVEQRIFGNGYLDLDGDGVNEGDGKPYYLRPSLVQFLNTKNVLVEGVTLKSSPFWTTHFVLCENVTVRGTTIRHGTTNDDGIDPDGSRYVLIEDTDIHPDDDAIAIKAGRDADGRAYQSTAYVVIRNNRLFSTVGGAMSIGSEMSGGVEWVFIENNVGQNENGRGLYVKSNLDRGGFVRHVYVRDLDILSAVQGFEITSDYKGYRGGNFPADVHDIYLRDVRIWEASEIPMRLLGQSASPVRRISLRDVHFRGSDAAPVLREVENLQVTRVTINGKPWLPPE
jgi:polygalacturonase/Na+/proline symporter